MTHTAVRVDAANLMSNIPAEIVDAFDDFLDQYGVAMPMTRSAAVRVITSVFHRYCRQVLRIGKHGTQVIRMLDVIGYLPEWVTSKTGENLLVVRGLQLSDAAMKGEFKNV